MFIKVQTAERKNFIVINITNIDFFDETGFVLMSSGTELNLDDESYRKLLMSIAPKQKGVKDNSPKEELLKLFEQLHKLTGGKGKAVFSLGREKKLNDLLTKHRMTPELLIKAATNIGKDAFLQGDNDNHKRYGDVDYLLRPDKAAKWAEDQAEKKKGMF